MFIQKKKKKKKKKERKKVEAWVVLSIVWC